MTNDDNTIEDETGNWLHERLMERFGLETEVWAIERVSAVTTRLNAARYPQRPLIAEILWMQEMSAFIAPGPYLYISRELLQRTASDDPAAFAIAHEMGHHDLQHTRVFRGQFEALRHVPAGFLPAVHAVRVQGPTAMLNNLVQLTLLGPEREAQADEYAMRLCLRAGYHRDRCQDVFEILEANYLDHRDLDEVFGPDKPATERPFLPGIRRHGAFDPRGVLSRVTAWGQERGRVHPPIRIRIETLKKRFPT